MVTSSLEWEGAIDFAIVNEREVREAGLLDNLPRLFEAIKSGRFDARKHHIKNKVTNYARQYVASILAGAAATPLVLPSKMQLGTGSGTPQATDTDLWSPSAATLKAISSSQLYLNYFAQFICTWLTTDSIIGSWTEIGLKDANGNLWAHANVTGLPAIVSGEMLIGQWAVQMIGN